VQLLTCSKITTGSPGCQKRTCGTLSTSLTAIELKIISKVQFHSSNSILLVHNLNKVRNRVRVRVRVGFSVRVRVRVIHGLHIYITSNVYVRS
jgi:hypothetical protein